MRVVELTAFHVRVPLKRVIRHASQERHETENLIVRCTLEDRTEGFGEGVPRDYVTGETIEGSAALLRAADFGQLEPCRDFAHAVAQAERLTLPAVPGDDRGCLGNAARAAVELALLDAYGKHFGEPLSSVTRLVAPEIYRPNRHVRYSGAITSARGRKTRLAGYVLWAYGFRQIKVKVGITGNDDVARLKLIRGCVGRRMDIRVDANEAWTPDNAAERIQEIEPFGISSVEQPLPHGDLGRLSGIRSRVQTPIMLDESLCSLIDAQTAIDTQACDLFNLRLSKCGGFIPTLRLAQFATRHRLGYQLGCQVGETGVLSAAGRAFATSVGDIRYAEGSYDRHLVKEHLTTRDITFTWGGWAPAFTDPGLGVTVDPAALERVTVSKEPLVG